MAIQSTQNVRAVINQLLISTATTIEIRYEANGIAVAPPAPNTGNSIVLQLLDRLNDPQRTELISYTGRTGTNPYLLTGVVRDIGGTGAKQWRAGCYAISASSSSANPYLGTFTTLTELQTALPTANAGDYAQVDAGAGSTVQNYFWDVTNAAWVLVAGGTSSANPYRGTFTTLTALQTGLPTANAGDYAQVDAGVGSTVQNYFWDVTNAAWVLVAGGTSSANPYRGTFTTLTALQTGLPTANAGDYAQVDAGAGSSVQNYFWDVTNAAWVLVAGGSSSSANPYRGTFTTLTDLQTALPTANAGDYAQVDAGAGSSVQNYFWDVTNAAWVLVAGGSSSSANPYRGTFTTLTALQTALPTANAGDYAQVDAGAGSSVQNYFWDVTNAAWVLVAGGSSSSANPALSLNESVVGTMPTVIGSIRLAAGTYPAPSAEIGAGNPLYAATLELRKSDGTVLATIGGTAGGLAWRTAALGFTLTATTNIDLVLYCSTALEPVFIKGLTF